MNGDPIKKLIATSVANEMLKKLTSNTTQTGGTNGQFDYTSLYGKLDKEVDQALKDAANLNGTLAGSIAKKMDAEDGSVDGFIDSSVWNKYAGEHGGKDVKNKISTVNAMNSITTYIVRETANLKVAIKTEIQKEIEKMKQETLAELERMDDEEEKAKAKEEMKNPQFGLE